MHSMKRIKQEIDRLWDEMQEFIDAAHRTGLAAVEIPLDEQE